MYKRRHVNEFRHTNFADTGRIAGIGIVEDNYNHDSTLKSYNHQPKFEHKDHGENGDVVIYNNHQPPI